jgi:hypothetical protein
MHVGLCPTPLDQSSLARGCFGYSGPGPARNDLSRSIRRVPRGDPQRPHVTTSCGSELDPIGRTTVKLPQLSHTNLNSSGLTTKYIDSSRRGKTIGEKLATYRELSKKRAIVKFRQNRLRVKGLFDPAPSRINLGMLSA